LRFARPLSTGLKAPQAAIPRHDRARVLLDRNAFPGSRRAQGMPDAETHPPKRPSGDKHIFLKNGRKIFCLAEMDRRSD
jgi:hypothetical protein